MSINWRHINLYLFKTTIVRITNSMTNLDLEFEDFNIKNDVDTYINDIDYSLVFERLIHTTSKNNCLLVRLNERQIIPDMRIIITYNYNWLNIIINGGTYVQKF